MHGRYQDALGVAFTRGTIEKISTFHEEYLQLEAAVDWALPYVEGGCWVVEIVDMIKVLADWRRDGGLRVSACTLNILGVAGDVTGRIVTAR